SAILGNTSAGIVSSSANAQAISGLVPGDLVQVGNNFVVSSSNAFGATLLAGAPGYTTTDWVNRVLKSCSMSSIHGPWNQDDGGMSENQKVGAGLGKSSAIGKDITSGTQGPINFASGVPSTAVNNFSTTNLAKTFSVTPAAGTGTTAKTNQQTMTN